MEPLNFDEYKRGEILYRLTGFNFVPSGDWEKEDLATLKPDELRAQIVCFEVISKGKKQALMTQPFAGNPVIFTDYNSPYRGQKGEKFFRSAITAKAYARRHFPKIQFVET